jgi:hypothetical protein
MMSISYPRDSTGNTNSYKNIGNNAGGKYCVMDVFVVDEYQRHSEDKPDKSGGGAARMNASEMLQY